MSDVNWYAVKVRTRSESAAVASLRHHDLETYCPQIMKRRKYSDRTKTVLEAIFPGYLFCRFDVFSKAHLVLASVAVEYIVKCGTQLVPVPISELDAVRRAVECGGMAATQPGVGEPVRVVAGPLRGVEGILVRDKDRPRFVVSVQLINGSVSVDIDQDFVECIALPMGQHPIAGLTDNRTCAPPTPKPH
jgi:transcription antitermination factor NusG